MRIWGRKLAADEARSLRDLRRAALAWRLIGPILDPRWREWIECENDEDRRLFTRESLDLDGHQTIFGHGESEEEQALRRTVAIEAQTLGQVEKKSLRDLRRAVVMWRRVMPRLGEQWRGWLERETDGEGWLFERDELDSDGHHDAFRAPGQDTDVETVMEDKGNGRQVHAQGSAGAARGGHPLDDGAQGRGDADP